MTYHVLVQCLILLTSLPTAYTSTPNGQTPLVRPPSAETAPSRRIILHTTSESVSGSYPLYDLLHISTQSGSISASVTPHSASSEDPSHPATLQLFSTSGSIHADLSGTFIEHDVDADYARSLRHQDDGAVRFKRPPERHYITSVDAQSGTIFGVFPLGVDTKLESRSGSLRTELVVMPVNASESRRLETVSRGGSQSIRIVDSYFWAEGRAVWWKGMVSRHESQSGSIDIEYPDSWEGEIEAEAESENVSITGRDVEIIRRDRGRVFARKGAHGNGKVFARASSGRVDLRFG